jgi:putative nucleotidyltransferase with HDIG domain
MNEEITGQSRARRLRALSTREATTSWSLVLAFLLVSVPLALPAVGDASLLALGALVLAYAYASRVEFEVGPGVAVPTQLVFVPMLMLLPAGLVPLAVAAGYVLGGVTDPRRTRLRALILIGTSWYAIGPALVFLAIGPAAPHRWWAYPLAFAAQVLLDTAHAVAREWFALGLPPSLSLQAIADVYRIDGMLSPVGLLAGLAAQSSLILVLAVLPLMPLLRLFARERGERIDNALALSAAYRGTALLLGDVVEADDTYTALHSRNVVELAVAVAEQLGLQGEDLRRVEFGALLHDVGKIKVPKEILNKPAALTPEEWEIVRRHPADGEAMLRSVGGALAEVGTIVRAHHERWDGGGYPDGLAGEQIPIGARIVCACDAYSALTTDRPYRKARPIAAALEELRACAGTQFDPVVVDALARLEGPRAEAAPLPLAA